MFRQPAYVQVIDQGRRPGGHLTSAATSQCYIDVEMKFTCYSTNLCWTLVVCCYIDNKSIATASASPALANPSYIGLPHVKTPPHLQDAVPG